MTLLQHCGVSGPTTHPKNLSYVKMYGTIKSVHGSGLPPLEGDIIDGGAWIQQEYLPSGETVAKADISNLIRCYILTFIHVLLLIYLQTTLIYHMFLQSH